MWTDWAMKRIRWMASEGRGRPVAGSIVYITGGSVLQASAGSLVCKSWSFAHCKIEVEAREVVNVGCDVDIQTI